MKLIKLTAKVDMEEAMKKNPVVTPGAGKQSQKLIKNIIKNQMNWK